MESVDVLHITTHMGGGVGKVLSGIASFAAKEGSPFRHRLILLEEPEKRNFVDICRANGVGIRVAKGDGDLLEEISGADILQLEWWHHPLMCGWLARRFPKLPMRLVIWSHVSGCFYPYISPRFLRVPHQFLFTSRYSLENPYWDEETREYAKSACAVVNSSGGFDAIRPREEEGAREGFCLGYVGTQDFSKMHPDVIRYCHAVQDIPGIHFRLVGDRSSEGAILEQARRYGMEDKFRFVGYVSDVGREFSRMDAVGYLLNPTHFGTTENALLEAMAAGLPVICLDQCAEKYLVQHGKTGLLVGGVEEYGRAVRYLWSHPEERRRLGRAAREYVLEHFSVEKTVRDLHGIYEELLSLEKRVFSFPQVFGKEPHEFFLSCLPPDLRSDFPAVASLPHILRGENKSSLGHFFRTYPGDDVLRRWNAALQKL